MDKIMTANDMYEILTNYVDIPICSGFKIDCTVGPSNPVVVTVIQNVRENGKPTGEQVTERYELTKIGEGQR